MRRIVPLAGIAVALSAGFGLQAQPPDPDGFRFDRYHSVEEFQRDLARLSLDYSTLTRLIEIGRSRQGRAILAIEINNPATGRRETKPGFYVDGNIHGGEVLGGEAALFFVHHLLENYAGDSRIRRLVDTTAFYVVPLVNPDGRAISVDTPENHRWNVRPTDEDGDGLLDEDPPEDLDGDGRILRMRWPDPAGRWVVDPEHPREMLRRDRSGPGGVAYQFVTEGIDNDGDGQFNEDRIGGVDLNRNFPANWHPAQFASGPYPLSEPESRALVEYITSRPQIAAIHTYHTSGGLILRFPTLADQDWDYPPSDLNDYRQIAEEGIALTGYSNFAFEKKAIVDLMNPGHGVFNDWGSKIFGVLAITTEMWKHAFGGGSAALADWNDRVLDGKGFVDWYPFDHPQLGTVELGGWDRWSTSSPPHPLIQAELERNTRWVLTFAEKVPRVEVLDFKASRVGNTDRFQVQARVANVGWMATATDYARDVLKLAQPVKAEILMQGTQLISGDREVDLGVLPGAREEGPAVREVGWEVRLEDSSREGSIQLRLKSQKAGSVIRDLKLKPN